MAFADEDTYSSFTKRATVVHIGAKCHTMAKLNFFLFYFIFFHGRALLLQIIERNKGCNADVTEGRTTRVAPPTGEA